jgi:hypothetical protein
VRTVFVIENEITYLALPQPDDAMVIRGSGYAVPVLEPLSWLGDLEVSYWGDIDTHGFVILDRLRSMFPKVRSMLMDRETLLAHRGQWVTEPSPARDVTRLPFRGSVADVHEGFQLGTDLGNIFGHAFEPILHPGDAPLHLRDGRLHLGDGIDFGQVRFELILNSLRHHVCI